MTANTPHPVFTDAGHSGIDTWHISLRVYEVADTENGALVTKHKVFIEGSDGNFQADTPTYFIFGVVEEGWEFESFELGGKSWPGIAVTPDNGDITVSSDDPTKRTVVMHDLCEQFLLYRYQIVLKNPSTGAIATTDPSLQNIDKQRSRP